jgi:DNA-binding response OmpR family regulator
MRLKPTILCIDDDPNFGKLIEVVLSRLGATAKVVSSPEKFLELAKSLQPDLYIIDLQLKNSSGMDLIKPIREGLTPDAFIMVISGANDPEKIAHAIELGASDYILKPLDRVLLATKLSQFIETDEIREHSAKEHAPKIGAYPIRLQFNGVIEAVDELGVKFSSATLTPKGTVLKLGSDFFKMIGAPEKEYLVTVASTWLVPETKQYGAYAEFDDVSPEFLQLLRGWLTRP